MKIIETLNNESDVFTELLKLSTIDFLSQENIQSLIDEYYLGWSSEKTISPLYKKLLDMEYNGTIESAIVRISQIVSNKFSNKWNKLYDAFTYEYSLLKDFEIEEIETPNINESTIDTSNESVTETLNETVTPNTETKNISSENKKIVETNNDNLTKNKSAYNSSTFSPNEQEVKTNSKTTESTEDENYSTSTETEKGTITTSNNNTNIKVISNNNQKTTSGTNTKKTSGLNKKTYQEIIESEILLRNNNTFLTTIFSDIDTILTLNIYL